MDGMKLARRILVLGVAAAVTSPAQTLTTLLSFNGTNGANPSNLVQGADGNLYGTTYNGGNSGSTCNYSCGTIFKITPQGSLTTLYSFSGADGAFPYAGLVFATDGNFYGTTTQGGDNGCNTKQYKGCGTIFKITPGGSLTTLHSFRGTDGMPPLAMAGLVAGADGNLYGTTQYGGANGSGMVFRITPSGAFTTLYDFCSQSSCADGASPLAGLVQATDGDFYGTTLWGGISGTSQCPNPGCGTIFRITPEGSFRRLRAKPEKIIADVHAATPSS